MIVQQNVVEYNEEPYKKGNVNKILPATVWKIQAKNKSTQDR